MFTRHHKVAVGLLAAGGAFLARQRYQQSRESPVGGKIVLITGGSRGLGLALARQLVREGCKVAICARNLDELSAVQAEFSRSGVEVFTVVCDVTRQGEVEEMLREVRQHCGSIDILINNAGQIKVGPVESMTVQDFEDAMNVMFWGTVYSSLALLPSLLQRRSGHIVNITSIGGKVGIPHLLPYTSAKYAAVGFSEGLRTELTGTGVQVTTIIPGLMRTGSHNAAMFKGDREAEARWFSLGAALPGVSINAERAACQIVAAIKRGDAEVVLTPQAAILAKAHALAPALTQRVMGSISQVLLPPSNTDRQTAPGWSIQALKTPAMRALLIFGRLAAGRLNQRTG